ncbi:MAG: methyltransferase domain-containing protein, partial [Bdellovibrionales bacterium]|nr:methyltransferase domain-containing protein [Bdellovibrionales bacterium]
MQYSSSNEPSFDMTNPFPPGGSPSESASCDAPDVHSSSEEYAQRFSGPVGAWILERQATSVLAMLEGLPIKTVLDIGGGHAQVCPQLIDRGYQVTVLGSTAESAKRVSSLVESGKCTFQVCSLTKTPFEDKTFDA